jgi:succinate dehydrogenase / fumarate reductase cytochrome b subunit
MFEEINLSIIDAIKTYQNMNKNKQPLSPHLSIYRWQVTNTLSIFHRLSGLLLFLAALDFAVWLGSIALGSGAYSYVKGIYSSNFLLLIWLLVSLSFFYHLFNGIRHLFWDLGKGFEESQVKWTGTLVILFSIMITGLFWYLLLGKFG